MSFKQNYSEIDFFFLHFKQIFNFFVLIFHILFFVEGLDTVFSVPAFSLSIQKD